MSKHPIPDAALQRPQRIQLRRTKGWRMPPNTVKVDRTTKWGNPFGSSKLFHLWLDGRVLPDTLQQQRQLLLDCLAELRGKNLACWCESGAACHADVLLEIANA